MSFFIRTGLANRIGRYNITWNQKGILDQNLQFKKAMLIAEEEFFWSLTRLVKMKLPAQEIVRAAYE